MRFHRVVPTYFSISASCSNQVVFGADQTDAYRWVEMKIGVVTYFDGLNYGAVLQAYSTHEMLKQLGHEPIMVNYKPDSRPQFPWWRLFQFHSPASLVSNIQTFTKQRNFLSFRPRFRKTRRYVSWDEIRNNPPDVDALICGSDTIWSPRDFSMTKKFNPYWFLSFGGDDIGRIAYAPSFWREMPKDFLEAIRPCIDGFDALSVREEEYAQRLSAFLGRKVACVCDPAILYGREGLDTIVAESKSPVKGLVSEGYSLVYPLTLDRSRDIRYYDWLKRHSNRNVIIGRSWFVRGCGENALPDPIGFLWLVKNAKCVVTSAFHGTVYAVLAHRPFVTLGWKDAKQNVRVANFLQRVGLSDRLIAGDDFDRFKRLIAEPVDWESVDEKIAKWRSESMSYLVEALAKIEQRRAGH